MIGAQLTLLNVQFEQYKLREGLLHMQFAWDIRNTTQAGKLNQINLATNARNFPAETMADAFMYTAATLADPTLASAAPPNGTAPVCLQSWHPKVGVVWLLCHWPEVSSCIASL